MFRRSFAVATAPRSTGFTASRRLFTASSSSFGGSSSPFMKGSATVAMVMTGALSYAAYESDVTMAWFGGGGKKADGAKDASSTMKPHDNYSNYPVEIARLTIAPEVPPPINRNYPVILRADISYDAFVGQLSRKYKYEYWGFNNSCPGPFIRAREGDVLEVNVVNNDPSGMPHNIDFHACDGPGGGAPLLLASQGQKRSAQFLLTHPGLFVYHCAAAPIPMHIANGMYGMILVEPPEGLTKVDKEYYVMQSEFYVDEGGVDERGVVPIDYAKGLKEDADYVVFNGKEGALTDKNPLKAKVGEDVRIFFGNAGPNLTSAFHMIGANFDRCYRDGDIITPPMRNVQTTVVPPGGSVMVETKCQVPGNLTLIDHSIFRLDKGAVGYLMVTGPEQPHLYHSTQAPTPCVGCKTHP